MTRQQVGGRLAARCAKNLYGFSEIGIDRMLGQGEFSRDLLETIALAVKPKNLPVPLGEKRGPVAVHPICHVLCKEGGQYRFLL